MTGYWMEDWTSIPGRTGIFVYVTASRSTVGLPLRWVPGILSTGVKVAGARNWRLTSVRCRTMPHIPSVRIYDLVLKTGTFCTSARSTPWYVAFCLETNCFVFSFRRLPFIFNSLLQSVDVHLMLSWSFFCWDFYDLSFPFAFVDGWLIELDVARQSPSH